MRFAPGQVVAGKFHIVSILGEGAMGTVYAVEHQTLRTTVALKVLSPALARRPDQVERFLREGVAISRVRHRAVIQVYDAGEHESVPWIAMELLEGETLRARMARGGLTPKEAIGLLIEVLGGLAASHAQGIIHRDVKPTNIYLSRQADGSVQAKLLDFGIARVMDVEQRLTGAGMAMGTIHYMAPEQIHAARDVDARADLYAVGAILFETLTGRPPYRASSLQELLAAIATQPPPDLALASPQQPRVLVEIVNRCLAHDRAHRPQDAKQLAAMLEAALKFSDQQGGVQSTLVLPGIEHSRPGAVDPMAATAGGWIETAPSQPRMTPLPSTSAWQPPSAHHPESGGWTTPQPASHPGAYGTPQPGPNAHPQPGSYPGANPHSYPGSYPGSNPGSYPGSNPGSYAGQPAWPSDPSELFAAQKKRSPLWHLAWIAPLGLLLMVGTGVGVVAYLERDDDEQDEPSPPAESTSAVIAEPVAAPSEPTPTTPVMMPIDPSAPPAIEPAPPTLVRVPPPQHACVGTWQGTLRQSDGQHGSAVVTIHGTEGSCGGFVEHWPSSGTQCHYRLSGCASDGATVSASARTPPQELCSPVRMRFRCEGGQLHFTEIAANVTVSSVMSPRDPMRDAR